MDWDYSFWIIREFAKNNINLLRQCDLLKRETITSSKIFLLCASKRDICVLAELRDVLLEVSHGRAISGSTQKRETIQNPEEGIFFF